MKKKASRRLTAAFVMAAMLVTLMPSGAAFATVKADNQYLCYETDETIAVAKNIPNNALEVTDSTTVLTDQGNHRGWYVVDGNITVSNRIQVLGEVHLILKDGCDLTASEGIQVQDNDQNGDTLSPNRLVIYAQSVDKKKMGRLYASGVKYDAAIGSSYEQDLDYNQPSAGDITIHGGYIDTTNSIGGCEAGGSGNIVIHEGYINSHDGMTAIGAAKSSKKGSLIINGGTVIAQGNMAGIGLGQDASGIITINGGNVNARGKCGIMGAKDVVTTINAGKVTADGVYYAGIGGYKEKASGRINIHGGKIAAVGGQGAGIGGTQDGTNQTVINITGGEITARSDSYGAGIGGGREDKGGNINITEGKNQISIIASGGTSEYRGKYADGIGSGLNGGYWKINITGKSVDNSGVKVIANGKNKGINARDGLAIKNASVTVNTGGIYGKDVHIYSGNVESNGKVGLEGGDITIDDGVIIANGEEEGIGNGNVTINGGRIIAKGKSGAGIGGNIGYYDSITINDGYIVAEGGSAGIGDQNKGHVRNIYIKGGVIAAKGVRNGAGIQGDNITISSGNVEVTAGENVNGIQGNFLSPVGGDAVIHASSISDQSSKNQWFGLIIEDKINGQVNNKGRVYGNAATLVSDFEIPIGTVIDIPVGKNLTINSGATLTVNGSLINNGTIQGDGFVPKGILTGSGTFTDKGIVKNTVDNRFKTDATIDLDIPATIAYGSEVIFNATVNAKDGEVAFYRDAVAQENLIGTAKVNNGKAICKANISQAFNWSVKDYIIHAVYSGGDELGKASSLKNMSVEKGNLPAVTAPSGLKAIVGATLNSVSLSEGEQNGTWTWAKLDTVLNTVGNHFFEAIFTPTDMNYNAQTISVMINVEQATLDNVIVPENLTAVYGQTLQDVKLPQDANGTWTWKDSSVKVGDVGKNQFEAIFNPTDNKYKEKLYKITVIVEPAEFSQVTIPTELKATVGQTLKDVKLPLSNNGTWIWRNPNNSVGNITGTYDFEAIFTPNDKNYKAKIVKVSVAVGVKNEDQDGPSGGSSNKPSKPNGGNKPIVPNADGGQTSVIPEKPKPGDIVMVSPKPNEGFVVDKIVVTDKNGNVIEINKNPDGSYSFIQPQGSVTINVTYKKSENSDWNNPFTDVPKGAWYNDAVRYVYENGLMVGLAPNNFGANITTDRGQLVTMLWRMAGEPQATNGADFSDVPSNAYYAKAVAWAAENGITSGFVDGTFRPQTGLSREQMAALFMKYAEATGVGTSVRADISSYTDINPNSWSYDALSWAKAVGLLSGVSDTTMAPQATATRAQIAAVLQRYCETVAK